MPERIMPERWFYGTAGNVLIKYIALDLGLTPRNLAPGERRLGRFIVPTFQRPLVWTLEQKRRLIESIYIGMPIGCIVYNQPDSQGPCDGWLLDGQQRVTAICGYIAGDFDVCGWRYPDLPPIEQAHFDRVGIPYIETRLITEGACREVYDRLVYGGTPHA